MKKEKTIKVCSGCGCPLIWTFAFAYNEYLCLNCGDTFPMMGRIEVVETPQLKYQQRLYEKLWKVLYCGNTAFFLPRSRYAQTGCKKCTSDNHLEHLSDTEVLKDKIATEVFKRIINKTE